MQNLSQVFLHIIFIGSFAFFVVLATILLKPFRLHKQRPYSTAVMKTTYLVYLAVFLAYIYLLLFYFEVQPGADKGIISFRMRLEYVAFLVAFVVPNVAMLVRRKIKHWRVNYNIIASAFNIFILIYLVLRIWTTDWEF